MAKIIKVSDAEGDLAFDISSGGTGAITASAARENLGISSYTEIRSYASNATTNAVRISFPSTVNFNILYIDQNGRVCSICHTNGQSAVVTEISGSFESKAVSTTAVYLKIGIWVRATFIITSAVLSDIGITIST